jgi:hypothetical protein
MKYRQHSIKSNGLGAKVSPAERLAQWLGMNCLIIAMTRGPVRTDPRLCVGR